MTFWQWLFGALAVYAFYLSWRQYQRDQSALKISATVALAMALLLLAESAPYAQLALFGGETQASVIRTDCQEGQKKHIYYRFNTAHGVLSDVGPNGYGNPACENLTEGGRGTVWYLPENPAVHVWGNPRFYLGERLVTLILAVPLAFIFCFFGIRKRCAI